MTYRRCQICDYFEGGESILHSALTDGCKPRRLVPTEDGLGYICQSCLDTSPINGTFAEGEIALLEIEEDE